MSSENYNFKYTIKNVNIEQGTFEVLFTPESFDLTPITLNTYLLPLSYLDIRDENNELIHSSQDEVPFSVHVENTVHAIKPIQQWKKQYMMQQNLSELVGKEGTIVVSDDVVTIPARNPTPIGAPDLTENNSQSV